MELKTFIKEALVDIASGVKEANLELHEKHDGGTDVPFRIHRNIGDSKEIPGIEFDIAVTTGSESADSGKAGISVAQVFNIGGSMESKESDTYAHRIKFSIGLHSNWS